MWCAWPAHRADGGGSESTARIRCLSRPDQRSRGLITRPRPSPKLGPSPASPRARPLLLRCHSASQTPWVSAHDGPGAWPHAPPLAVASSIPSPGAPRSPSRARNVKWRFRRGSRQGRARPQGPAAAIQPHGPLSTPSVRRPPLPSASPLATLAPAPPTPPDLFLTLPPAPSPTTPCPVPAPRLPRSLSPSSDNNQND